MALQVKRAGADEYGTWIKMLVVGDPGAGKTRTASTWPDVLYANCEGGMMSVTDRQPAVVDIEESAQVRELVDVLGQPTEVREKMLGVPVKTVVVDTLDEIARILHKERLTAERKESFAMADWGWLGDQLRNIVRAFRNLDMNVIINVHVKSQEDSETGRTYFKAAIAGAMGDELPAYVDLALLAVARPVNKVVDGKTVREITRYFQTYPDAQHPWVKDRSGKLPMEFSIDFDTDYERFFKTIYGGVRPNASAVLSTVATPVATPAPEAPKRQTGAAKDKTDDKAQTLDQMAEELAEVAAATAPAEEQPAPAEEPTPEPAPEPEPAPVTEPEAPAPTEPELEAEPAPEETDISKEPWETCDGCGGTVENKDQADLSFIRHKQHLCRSCFAERKKAPRR